jgi:hypothetical protein
VVVSAAGEPTYQIYGETIATVVLALGERLEDAIPGAAGLYFTSNTLVGPEEREMVVVTLGSEGAMLRGELRMDVDGRPVRVLSTIGAGDTLTGALLARLAMSAFYPAAVAASLPEAVTESALACERWGALE